MPCATNRLHTRICLPDHAVLEKTSLARIFARAINCLHPENGEPCNVCEICVDFLTNRSMDLVEIDAASNTGVENIREIIEHLAFSPNRAQYKVFIIDEVHMLSKGAFNALLKTLEEPPKHAVFILATTEVHKVPPTVISRTQRFDFKKIDGEQMHKHLEMIASAEGIVIDQESLGLVVQAAEGGVRDALSILDRLSQYGSITKEIAEQLLGMTNIVSVQTLLSLLIKKDAKAALEYTEQLLLSGLDPIQFNKDLLEYLRKLLLLGSGAEASLSLAESQLVILKEQSVALSQNQLLHIIRLFLRAAKDFEISPSIELPFEIAVAESCLSNLSVLQHTATQKSVTSEKSVQYEHSNHAEMKHDTIPKPASEELNQSNVEVLEKNDEPKSSTEPEISLEILMQSWPQVLSLIKERQSAIFYLTKSCIPKRHSS